MEDKKCGPLIDGGKVAVLRYAENLKSTPLVPATCMHVLTNILYLLSTGETFSESQLSDLFFKITRLFQSKNESLRRMVYLLIRAIKVSDTERFMVTSELSKDVNCQNDLYRGNALRTLSRILDASTAQQQERYLVNALVDKNPFVASAAHICALNLLATAPEVVKRWVNEITESLTSRNPMVQFHALALSFEVKRADNLALQKVVTSLVRAHKSPFAECLLVRYAVQIIRHERTLGLECPKPMMDFIESCLRTRPESVTYEAAKAFCELAEMDDMNRGGSLVFGYDLAPAITVLQIMLTSPKPIVRFAGMRVLQRLSQHRAHVVARCTNDVEPLLNDQNRSVATLALTTLLKTGNEANVDKLVKQISAFVNDISDSFKLEIVNAVKCLCLQYPSKHRLLLAFLSSNLREEGSFELKSEIVEALIELCTKIAALQEPALLHLCEFIEDCEYPSLSAQVLYYLSSAVPRMSSPSKYVRFIYNRLILENTVVRAAGVYALTEIAHQYPPLRNDVMTLLTCCLTDTDDEVRERTNTYWRSLSALEKTGAEKEASVDLLSLDGAAALNPDAAAAAAGTDAASTAASVGALDDLLDPEVDVSVDALCESLQSHLASAQQDTTFDLSSVPERAVYDRERAAAASPGSSPAPLLHTPAGGGGGLDTSSAAGPGSALRRPSDGGASRSAALLENIRSRTSSIVAAADLGPLLSSTKGEPLTEREAEYTVTVVKHFFKDYLLLQLLVTNTMQQQELAQVVAQLTPLEGCGFTILGVEPIPSITFNTTGDALVVLKKNCDERAALAHYCVGGFDAKLTYVVKEEGDDIGIDDAYPLERLYVTTANYVTPCPLRPGEFHGFWDSLEPGKGSGEEDSSFEVVGKFQLSFKALKPAVAALATALNMAPCDKTDEVDTDSSKHTLVLSGSYSGGTQVLCKALVLVDAEKGVLMKLATRCSNEYVCKLMNTVFG
eukprot:GHVU01104046.1.p1 GENE.GHVU01104046.1~~GHVU01104046.1.p1  ORF type:complete len:959 (+),score=230.90 GHVU01104046.1:2712-5588(+)